MNPEDFAWLCLSLPLAAALIITLFTWREPRFSAQLSIGAVLASFGVSIALFVMFRDAEFVAAQPFKWLEFAGLDLQFALGLDRLSLLTCLVVTGVGSAIQVYSYGYMRDDPRFASYFAQLSLFTFAMLGIVLADNFIMMFICWELVGLSSYLLIGFWYERDAAADAAKKAFLTNRLGDFGFLLGILLLWALLATPNFNALNFFNLKQKLMAEPAALGAWSCIAGLLIFCGAAGKSAQFPLHVWLPDAMEGPTPVSALIHAATMVAAGVYMLCRVYFLYLVTPAWPAGWTWLHGISALDIIAWIGAFTALLAAVIALQQNDIKRVLAYSTLSQLGYMILAVGAGGPTPAMFHLVTHAFFKALLFLGAGSVIYALHHEQDIWNMGGLRRRMPLTFAVFLVATLAICGLPPFSGFYSKDQILATALHHSLPLFMVASVVSLLTACYMFRLLFVVFVGKSRGQAVEHAAESPLVMTIPLLALAVPSLLSGLWGIDRFLLGAFRPNEAVASLPWWNQILAPFSHAPLAALVSLGAVLFGFSFAYGLYAGASRDPVTQRLPGLSRALRQRLYFDQLYAWLIALTHEALARLANWIDRWLISGLGIRGLHGTTEITGRALRLLQTGNLQTYAFLVVLGVAVVLWCMLR